MKTTALAIFLIALPLAAASAKTEHMICWRGSINVDVGVDYDTAEVTETYLKGYKPTRTYRAEFAQQLIKYSLPGGEVEIDRDAQKMTFQPGRKRKPYSGECKLLK